MTVLTPRDPSGLKGDPRQRVGQGSARLVALLAAIMVLLAGCGGGTDAVTAQGGGFELVSPGGESQFFYSPDERKPVGEISGPSVREPRSRVDLADYSNKVVVLSFWGSWCGPCRAEQDFFNEEEREFRDRNVQFIGVNVRDNQASALDFMNSKKVAYPSIYDRAARVLLALRGMPLSGMPSTVILDRNHRVAAIWIGSVPPTGFISTLREIITEA